MKIVVLRETQEGEARVALMPESVKKLVALGAVVQVESRAGLTAARMDDDYREAGAEISSDREALLADADALAAVNRPAANDFARLKKGAVVIGFLRPLDEPAALVPAIDRGITTFSVELIPRITRAQAMDALSSMATVAGYKAVLIGAAHIPRRAAGERPRRRLAHSLINPHSVGARRADDCALRRFGMRAVPPVTVAAFRQRASADSSHCRARRRASARDTSG